jgi:hypothetical protein
MQIAFVERQIVSQNNAEISLEKLQWQVGVMELVELVYALHEAGCFGNISLKMLFITIGKMFGCEITNYYRLFWDIKNRTGEERTFFLNKLQKILSDKLARMDSDGYR